MIDAENWALGHQGDRELVNKSSSLLWTLSVFWHSVAIFRFLHCNSFTSVIDHRFVLHVVTYITQYLPKICLFFFFFLHKGCLNIRCTLGLDLCMCVWCREKLWHHCTMLYCKASHSYSCYYFKMLSFWQKLSERGKMISLPFARTWHVGVGLPPLGFC